MDTTLPISQPNQTTQEIQPENAPIPEETSEEVAKINIYPIIRHLFLIVCLLLAFSIIIFLIYQNGKSIYDQGI